MGLSASLNCKSATAQLLWEPELSECHQFTALTPPPEIPLQIFNAFSFESLQGPSPLPPPPTCSRRKSLPFFQTKKPQICFFPGAKPIHPTADLTRWLRTNFYVGSRAYFAEAPTRVNCEEQKYISADVQQLSAAAPLWRATQAWAGIAAERLRSAM